MRRIGGSVFAFLCPLLGGDLTLEPAGREVSTEIKDSEDRFLYTSEVGRAAKSSAVSPGFLIPSSSSLLLSLSACLWLETGLVD